jgi:acetyl-CoA acetyltransferase
MLRASGRNAEIAGKTAANDMAEETGMSDVTLLRDRTALAGYGHTRFGRRGELGHVPLPRLVLEAVLNACEDAGLDPKEIDGWTSYGSETIEGASLAAALGCHQLSLTGMAWSGGGGGMCGAFMHGAMAVATGQAKCVAVTRSIVQVDDGSPGHYRRGQGFALKEVERTEAGGYPSYGLASPGITFSLAARRHMHRFGTTIDHFGEVAIAARLMAAKNPLARFRQPITMQEHHESRMIADPLRLLDYTMESDVASCALITTAERAKDLRQPLVRIAGVAMGAPRRFGGGLFSLAGGVSHQMHDDDWINAGQAAVAKQMYDLAGLGPNDVHVAEIYDHFTPMVLQGLEAFGFVPMGESGPFVADGNIRMGGRMPTNTHGGNLAECYSHGMTHVFEAMRQIRGTSCNQVEDAEVALVVAGSSPAPTSAMLLRSE